MRPHWSASLVRVTGARTRSAAGSHALKKQARRRARLGELPALDGLVVQAEVGGDAVRVGRARHAPDLRLALHAPGRCSTPPAERGLCHAGRDTACLTELASPAHVHVGTGSHPASYTPSKNIKQKHCCSAGRPAARADLATQRTSPTRRHIATPHDRAQKRAQVAAARARLVAKGVVVQVVDVRHVDRVLKHRPVVALELDLAVHLPENATVGLSQSPRAACTSNAGTQGTLSKAATQHVHGAPARAWCVSQGNNASAQAPQRAHAPRHAADATPRMCRVGPDRATDAPASRRGPPARAPWGWAAARPPAAAPSRRTAR